MIGDELLEFRKQEAARTRDLVQAAQPRLFFLCENDHDDLPGSVVGWGVEFRGSNGELTAVLRASDRSATAVLGSAESALHVFGSAGSVDLVFVDDLEHSVPGPIGRSTSSR